MYLPLTIPCSFDIVQFSHSQVVIVCIFPPRHHTKELEHGGKRLESIIHAQKEQIKYFKDQVQNCDRLREENVRLKNEVKSLDQVQIALGGTRQQVEDIIRNENNIESLALLASILKKYIFNR